MKSKTKLLFLFAILITADQTAKFFSNNSICNKNIAWSISLPPAIFYFAWIVITAFLIRLFLKTSNYYYEVFLTLILTGAISNIVDRARFGCVVDYIDFKFFPVFNFADVYITVGVILLFIIARKHNKRGNPILR